MQMAEKGLVPGGGGQCIGVRRSISYLNERFFPCLNIPVLRLLNMLVSGVNQDINRFLPKQSFPGCGSSGVAG
jgi:hypothetical protein